MNKINTLQFCTCFITILVASFLGIEFYSIIKFSGVNILFTILLSFFIGIIILKIFLTIFNYQQNLNLKEKIKTLFSNKLSYVIIILISLCLFCIQTIYSYDLNNFIISQFLSETPIYIVSILFAILIIYINNKGIEIITRVGSILFFINTILYLLFIFGHGKGFTLENFKPILENGMVPIIKSVIYCIGLTVNPIFLLLIIPKDSIVANHKTNKYIILSFIIGFIMIFSIALLTIGILGINLASLYQYPTYMVLKRSNLFGVLDRVENFIIIQWIFEIFITISLIVQTISKMLKIKPYIITVMSLIISLLLFRNNTFFYQLSLYIIPYLTISILILILIIFIQIKRKSKLS